MRRAGRIMGGILSFLLLIGMAAILCQEIVRRYQWEVLPEKLYFTETAESLENPDRGFYAIYGFQIRDESVRYAEELAERMKEDTDTVLAMIQINLQEYRFGELSNAALENIEDLFRALAGTGKRWIVRFLYDWNGENAQYEPQDIEIIKGHMRQVSGILNEYKDCIFTMQGLFIGNWGEMNGTAYSDQESLGELAEQLAAVTDEDIFLSVRMPAQWRKIAETADPEGHGVFSRRLGLFNDGMLGNVSDYGTYSDRTREEAGDFSAWTREEELAFQEQLCGKVPNGGEVIVDNPYNDFEAALADLKTMHITYLNKNYDKAVLEKWAETIVHTDDCFDGMDGLSYIERHLGYRLLISEAEISYTPGRDTVELELAFRNVGFAPLYRSCNMRIVMQKESGELLFEKELQAEELSGLTGGNGSAERAVLSIVLPLPENEGAYEVYLEVTDPRSGEDIILANVQKMQKNGKNRYLAGEFTVNKLNFAEIINKALSQNN